MTTIKELQFHIAKKYLAYSDDELLLLNNPKYIVSMLMGLFSKYPSLYELNTPKKMKKIDWETVLNHLDSSFIDEDKKETQEKMTYGVTLLDNLDLKNQEVINPPIKDLKTDTENVDVPLIVKSNIGQKTFNLKPATVYKVYLTVLINLDFYRIGIKLEQIIITIHNDSIINPDISDSYEVLDNWEGREIINLDNYKVKDQEFKTLPVLEQQKVKLAEGQTFKKTNLSIELIAVDLIADGKDIIYQSDIAYPDYLESLNTIYKSIKNKVSYKDRLNDIFISSNDTLPVGNYKIFLARAGSNKKNKQYWDGLDAPSKENSDYINSNIGETQQIADILLVRNNAINDFITGIYQASDDFKVLQKLRDRVKVLLVDIEKIDKENSKSHNNKRYRGIGQTIKDSVELKRELKAIQDIVKPDRKHFETVETTREYRFEYTYKQENDLKLTTLFTPFKVQKVITSNENIELIKECTNGIFSFDENKNLTFTDPNGRIYSNFIKKSDNFELVENNIGLKIWHYPLSKKEWVTSNQNYIYEQLQLSFSEEDLKVFETKDKDGNDKLQVTILPGFDLKKVFKLVFIDKSGKEIIILKNMNDKEVVENEIYEKRLIERLNRQSDRGYVNCPIKTYPDIFLEGYPKFIKDKLQLKTNNYPNCKIKSILKVEKMGIVKIVYEFSSNGKLIDFDSFIIGFILERNILDNQWVNTLQGVSIASSLNKLRTQHLNYSKTEINKAKRNQSEKIVSSMSSTWNQLNLFMPDINLDNLVDILPDINRIKGLTLTRDNSQFIIENSCMFVISGNIKVEIAKYQAYGEKKQISYVASTLEGNLITSKEIQALYKTTQRIINKDIIWNYNTLSNYNVENTAKPKTIIDKQVSNKLKNLRKSIRQLIIISGLYDPKILIDETIKNNHPNINWDTSITEILTQLYASESKELRCYIKHLESELNTPQLTNTIDKVLSFLTYELGDTKTLFMLIDLKKDYQAGILSREQIKSILIKGKFYQSKSDHAKNMAKTVMKQYQDLNLETNQSNSEIDKTELEQKLTRLSVNW